jgi:hypothetical protein
MVRTVIHMSRDAPASSKRPFVRECAPWNPALGSSRFARWVAGALLVQVLWILALAANPGLHRWAHDHQAHHHGSDPQHGEHHCVVDLFSSGTLTAAKAPAVFEAPSFTARVRFFAGLTESARGLRPRTGVLEHAPPAVG